MKEDDFFDDNYNKINKKHLNSLKTELLSHGYYLFSNILPDQNINKNGIYNLAKLFFLCFKENDDSNDYVNINEYINIINKIINDNSLEDEEETYIFIRDNILSLGEFFHYNNNYSLSEEEIINILIELYSIILFHHFEYLINNFDLIKENINKNVRNTTHKLMNFNLKTNNKDNILPNITETFDIVNSSNLNIKNNYKDTQDINLIIESIYYFLKVSAPDINSGKNVLKIIGNKLKEKNEDNKINDIIYLLLFYECCIKDDEKITCGLLEYITDLFLNDKSNIEINENNIYYDIILDSYYLIYKNETLSKQYISLLSQIFMKENEKNLKKNILLSQLIQIYHKEEKIMNKIIKLFFYFLINISYYYKEKRNNINNNDNIINNEDNNSIIINNILINLNSLIKSFNNNEFSNLNNANNIVSSSTNNVTYNIYNNNINLMKIGIDDYNLLILHFFNFKNLKEEPNINSIEFYLYFHLFLINNTDIIELINDYPKKDKIYHNTLKIITILEIMLIQSSYQENNKLEKDLEDNKRNIYINDIIIAIQIIIKVIDKVETKYYIQDCYILYNSLEKNIQNLIELQKLNEIGNNEIDFFNLRIIYSIIFFILSQFTRLINIPNSIIKIHKEILDCILKSNEQCGKYLSIIDVSNFNFYNKSSIEPNLQYLKDLLLSEENNEKYFFNYNSLKQILDVIYSKIFGKDTSLHIFFDNQIMNSKYFYDIENCYNNNSLSKESDNITEVKDSSIVNRYDNNYNENDMDEISLHIVEQKNKIKNDDNQSENLFISNHSKINIPHNNDNNQIFERTITNSITNEENLFRNIKL